jgi:hypothetical protein
MASFKPDKELEWLVDLAKLRQPNCTKVITELEDTLKDVLAILKGTMTPKDIERYEYRKDYDVQVLDNQIGMRVPEGELFDYDSEIGTRLRLQSITDALDEDFTGIIQWMWNYFSMYFEQICTLDVDDKKRQYTKEQVQERLQRCYSGAEKGLERCRREFHGAATQRAGWLFRIGSVEFIDGIGYTGKDKIKRQKDVTDAWRRAHAVDRAFQGVKEVFRLMKARDKSKLNL